MSKQYKLKKWYPSLPKDWKVGDTVKEKLGGLFPYGNSDENRKSRYISKEEIENNPEFWEEIEESYEKEPLFTTEDGVDIYGDKYQPLNTEGLRLRRMSYTAKILYKKDVHLEEYLESLYRRMEDRANYPIKWFFKDLFGIKKEIKRKPPKIVTVREEFL